MPEGPLKVLREKGYDGKKLIFGIRPEDINTEAAFLETFPNSVVHATISVSELLSCWSLTFTAKLATASLSRE